MALDQIDVDEYDAQMSFLEHLEALRWHLVRSVAAVVVGSISRTVLSAFYDRNHWWINHSRSVHPF